MTITQAQLKRCPFDDGKRRHVANPRHNGNDGLGPANCFWVQCSCGAEGPTSRDTEEAIAVWNRRAALTQEQ